jgi:hypothetical protein
MLDKRVTLALKKGLRALILFFEMIKRPFFLTLIYVSYISRILDLHELWFV